MNRNFRNFILVLCAVLVSIIIGLVFIVTTETMGVSTETEADKISKSKKNYVSSTLPEKKEAEKLIKKTVSREKIKKNVGEWEKFEMSSNGCERGVYAGKFYYEKFTIFSRTYNKGKTFRIISVN